MHKNIKDIKRKYRTRKRTKVTNHDDLKSLESLMNFVNLYCVGRTWIKYMTISNQRRLLSFKIRKLTMIYLALDNTIVSHARKQHYSRTQLQIQDYNGISLCCRQIEQSRRYFVNEGALKVHFKSKPHKRR